MTTDPIRTLPANRDTDARIARAMGCDVQNGVWCGCKDGRHNDQYGRIYSMLKEYTSDSYDGWAAMRECVEWLRWRGFMLEITCDITGWRAEADNGKVCHRIDADDLPHAVGLLVLMVGEADTMQPATDPKHADST